MLVDCEQTAFSEWIDSPSLHYINAAVFQSSSFSSGFMLGLISHREASHTWQLVQQVVTQPMSTSLQHVAAIITARTGGVMFMIRKSDGQKVRLWSHQTTWSFFLLTSKFPMCLVANCDSDVGRARGCLCPTFSSCLPCHSSSMSPCRATHLQGCHGSLGVLPRLSPRQSLSRFTAAPSSLCFPLIDLTGLQGMFSGLEMFLWASPDFSLSFFMEMLGVSLQNLRHRFIAFIDLCHGQIKPIAHWWSPFSYMSLKTHKLSIIYK